MGILKKNIAEKTVTRSAEETFQLGQRLASQMQKGMLVALSGDLGAGKTIMAKGIGSGTGVPEEEIRSPTYTLMIKHTKGIFPVFHWDFYRIAEIDELMTADFFELRAREESLFIIEWANLFPEVWVDFFPRFEIDIKQKDDNTRDIKTILKG
ncbi:MAG: tRNA (adenosine(37)-N6)-threonylcarbamoyltransferase complex ATPase subunit type 1 TsaE [bacterium]